MVPKVQKEPLMDMGGGGGQQRALGPMSTQKACSLEAGLSFKSTQILIKLAPRHKSLDS